MGERAILGSTVSPWAALPLYNVVALASVVASPMEAGQKVEYEVLNTVPAHCTNSYSVGEAEFPTPQAAQNPLPPTLLQLPIDLRHHVGSSPPRRLRLLSPYILIHYSAFSKSFTLV